MADNHMIFNKIAEALLVDYTGVYYVNAVTDEYQWYSVNADFHSLKLEKGGDDFFKNLIRDAKKVIYPEDLHIFTEDIQKDNLIRLLKDDTMERIEYRLMIDGKPVWHALRLIRGAEEGEDDYFVLGVMNIDEEHRRRCEAEKNERERRIYNQIAERLAEHYDVIYYVNMEVGNYIEFKDTDIYGAHDIQEAGEDFFADAQRNVGLLVHREDKARVKNLLTKDYLITKLETRKQYLTDYRLVVNGESRSTRFTASWAADHVHMIICVEDREEDVRKEHEHLKELKMANDLARRDELTGIRNTTAYYELVDSIQEKMDHHKNRPFAIVVCDVNDLKIINDTKGHRAGDECIRDACRLICSIFAHSPVFRVGGDEFVAVLSGADYDDRKALLTKIRGKVIEHLSIGEGPVVACGMAEFNAEEDHLVSTVFERADSSMYDNKQNLKRRKLSMDSYALKTREFKRVPVERKNKLDTLFDAISTVAEGNYVYVCDMKYDYSRWSKSAVDTFELPSEYMYGAGDLWEEHIHPDDKKAYHDGITMIFSGAAGDHDMQYRVKRPSGEFDVCTCRGFVIRTPQGEPEYFAGSIRNHGIQGHVDTLTGLRNQYGFFEDLQSNINRSASVSVCMVGLSNFSGINEIFGYHFGNRVLQSFGRTLYNYVGRTGHVYRLDGTKFAVMSNSLSSKEMTIKYDNFREESRQGRSVDGRNAILDLCGGMIHVDKFDIDSQTVYACLNYAYKESKTKKRGELVEFYNDLNDTNRQRIEKLQAIRGSIMRGCEGFFLMFQPVVEADTERLMGVEALLRWKNDTYGLVPPDHFIPLLEADPLFPTLGEWILKEALKVGKEILKDHPDFIMNVNLSYTQLEKPDFTDMVVDALHEADFPPNHLCLEVTERCRLLDMGLLKNVIISMKARGIRIALDDFGTGFSSIGLVKDLPFDSIKIDRSFVQRIEDDEKERELMKHFSGLASTFGARVCVEGIETEGMRDILQRFRVESFQGYYYAKPLLYDDLLEWSKGRS